MKKTDAYQVITDRILSLLEAGTVPWHKPRNGDVGMPKNLVTGKEYRRSIR
jgi:antirestriction protein ArdC